MVAWRSLSPDRARAFAWCSLDYPSAKKGTAKGLPFFFFKFYFHCDICKLARLIVSSFSIKTYYYYYYYYYYYSASVRGPMSATKFPAFFQRFLLDLSPDCFDRWQVTGNSQPMCTRKGEQIRNNLSYEYNKFLCKVEMRNDTMEFRRRHTRNLGLCVSKADSVRMQTNEIHDGKSNSISDLLAFVYSLFYCCRKLVQSSCKKWWHIYSSPDSLLTLRVRIPGEPWRHRKRCQRKVFSWKDTLERYCFD